MKLWSILFFLFVGSGFASQLEVKSASLEYNGLKIENLTFRAPIPGMENSAGYMTITNTSNKKITLVAAESDIADRVEFHDHVMKDGVMKMFQIDQLDILPQQTVQLKSGGLHLMFLGLKLTKQKLNVVDAKLITSDGVGIPITLTVQSVHHHHSHH